MFDRIPKAVWFALGLGILIAFSGLVGWSSAQPPHHQTIKSAAHKTENKTTQDISAETVAYYTEVLAWFTGVLAAVSAFQGVMLLRADKISQRTANALQRQGAIMAAVEGPIPLVPGLKLVQYAQIPGDKAVVDPVPPGPIPARCRILLSVENKGRTPLRLIEICMEKFIGITLPLQPNYIHTAPWGMVLEKGPIWLVPPDDLAHITPANSGTITATYPQGALWVYGYFAYWNLLDERTEHKFLVRWDLNSGFLPENRVGYT